MRKATITLVLVFVVFFNLRLFAQQNDSESIHGLFDLSLEELMNIKVTVATKTSTRLFETPAAVFVITSEDIRKSGATTIPDILRIVPGVEVVRINSHTYSVSIRGFTEEYSNKLLVMIDGMTIYTPSYAGVWWAYHDLVLEDIERIEVVRGPGGTLWGANAVNGVINIITKNASETQGTLITSGAGTEEAIGTYRYGDKLGENVYYRIYGKYSNHDDGLLMDGTEGNDEWDIFNTGIRLDWNKSKEDKLSFQGNIFKSHLGESPPSFSLIPPYTAYVNKKAGLKGGFIIGRWERKYDENSDMALQLYYHHSDRDQLHCDYSEERDTFDVDFQHRFRLSDIQELVWGLGYRFSRDEITDSSTFSINPSSRDLHLYNGFIQDQISLVPDKLKLTVGTKLEHNDYTGLEHQPSARLAWTPSYRSTIWGAFSRAVRTPSRYERDAVNEWSVIPGSPPIDIVGYGDDGVISEKMQSLELGYRFKPSDKLMFDFTTFANKYTDLRSVERGTSQFQMSPVPHILLPYIFDNKAYAETYGTEFFTSWKVTDSWKLSAAHSFIKINAHIRSSSTDTNAEANYEGRSPENQFYLGSSFDLPDNKELDLSLKYVDNLAAGDIGSYLRLDIRFSWQISKNAELNLVAQNLLDGKHPEYTSYIYRSTETERAFFANMLFRF